MSDEQTTELARVEALPAQRSEAAQLLSDIIAASRDPNVDAAKTEALANLAMKMQDREAERRFQMAKHRALMNMPRITKNGAIKNKLGAVQSRYSTFEDINRLVMPLLTAEGLSITFNVGHAGNMVTVQPILSYSDGELAYVEKGGEMVLAIDTTGSKNATQGAGSAASYGKRHSMKAMLNIIEEAEDDDGQMGAKSGYDALHHDQKALIDQARQEALKGTDSYAAWFKGLDSVERGFLGFNYNDDGETWHEQNKRNAALVEQK